MSNLPITTRVARVKAIKEKREAVPKQTSYIDPESGDATIIGSSPGSTSTSTELVDVMGEGTSFVSPKEEREKDPEEWARKQKGICNGTIKGDKSKVDCSNIVVGQEEKKVTTETPGTNYTGKLKKATKGDVLGYWDVKDSGRGINKANRYIKTRNKRLKKYTRKLEGIETKADDLDGDGVMSEKEIALVSSRLKGRKRRKYDKYTTKRTTELARKKEFEALRDGMANRSGKKVGSRDIVTGERNVKVGELTPDEQKKRLADLEAIKAQNAKKEKKDMFKSFVRKAEKLDTNIDLTSAIRNARKPKGSGFQMRGYGKK